MVQATAHVDLFKDLIRPIRRQADFLQASLAYRFLLYGGSRGPGKSYILRWGLVWRLIHWFRELGLRHVRVGIFCEDYPTLADRQISKIATEFPAYLGHLKTTKENGLGFYLHDDYGGGIITLRNLDDTQKYVGGEWAGIAIDEATRNPRVKFDDLRSCLRWPGIEDTFLWLATNPLGIGLQWVRALFIERDASAAAYEGLALGRMQELIEREFHYVQALPADNPHLTKEYWEDLHSQPDHIQKAWIHADWYALVGAVLGEWRASYHVIPPGKFTVPVGWRYAGGLDWGYRSHGCFTLFAGGPEDIVGVDEFYFRETHGFEVGLAIGHLCQGHPYVEYIAADTDMWAQMGQGAVTIAEACQAGIIKAYGGKIDQAPKLVEIVKKGERGRGFRLSKLNRLHEWLAWKPHEGLEPGGDLQPWNRPRLRFMADKCPNTIRTLPALPYAKPSASNTEPEDIDTTADDHCFDSVTGYLMSRPPLAERKKPPRSADQHPGFDRYTGRRKPRDPERQEAEVPEYEAPSWRIPRKLEETE